MRRKAKLEGRNQKVEYPNKEVETKERKLKEVGRN